MDAFRTALNKTLLISNIPNRNIEVVTTAPGKEHKPVSVLTDKFFREPAHALYFLHVDLSTKLKEKYPWALLNISTKGQLNMHTISIRLGLNIFLSFCFEPT